MIASATGLSRRTVNRELEASGWANAHPDATSTVVEKELVAWWAGLSDEDRQHLKDDAEAGTVDDRTQKLLMALTSTPLGMPGAARVDHLELHESPGNTGRPMWNPTVRDFILAW